MSNQDKVLTSRYDYTLNKDIIAKYPMGIRDQSKLLLINRDTDILEDKIFTDIVDILDSSYLIVFNNTKVMKSRIKSKRVTGGKSEIFILNILSDNEASALLKGKFKVGDKIVISDTDIATVDLSLGEGLYQLSFTKSILEIMEIHGNTPLPPYIDRELDEFDADRYQTVFSKYLGSVAAPTAGLHFTDTLIDRLNFKGIKSVEITLDVGIGTFRPITTDCIDDHIMHSERFTISESVAELINAHKKQGGKVLAVGTTVVRALESAGEAGFVTYGDMSTDIFIKESYKFKIIDAMLTNFHLPKSTLLTLVSAFAGYEKIMNAYSYAQNNEYRFYSYGDAMLIY